MLVSMGGLWFGIGIARSDEDLPVSTDSSGTDEEIAEAAFVAMALRAGGAFAHSCVAMAVTEEQTGPAEPPKG